MPSFYRVVSPAEYEDIQVTGVLRAAPASVEGKYLWQALEDARVFQKLLLSEGWETECIIVRVEVSDDAARRFGRFQMIDGIGPACFAELAYLNGAVVQRVIE